jgi:flagellar biogenesis protein FliO
LPPFPASDLGPSLVRLAGGLVFVLGLFLVGVWVARRWPWGALGPSHPPRLRVLEARGLGHRNGLYLVACEQRRLLVASSPAGVNLLAQLPDGPANEAAESIVDFRALVKKSLNWKHDADAAKPAPAHGH